MIEEAHCHHFVKAIEGDMYISISLTGPDGAVAMSSANGLVGTGFASLYHLQPRAGI